MGNVEAPLGSITTINIAGDIGASGANRLIQARNGITAIDAYAVYAEITANFNGSGSIGRITTNDHDINPAVHDGVFEGVLNAYVLQNDAGTVGMKVDGACSATITLSGLLRDDVTIEGPLSGNLTCTTISSVAGQPQPVVHIMGDLEANISCAALVGKITVDGQIDASKTITVNGTCYGEINAGALAGAIVVHDNLQFNTSLPTTSINVSSIASTGAISVGSAAGEYCDATIRVEGNVESGGAINVRRLERSVNSTGLISIGGSLSGSVTCTESASLEGQIIVNANNSGASWTGPVTVGSVVLDDGASTPNTAPHYERLSSTLGGGAVGKALFSIHEEDCLPHSNGYRLLEDFTAGQPIYVTFYGPLTLDDPEDPAVEILFHTPYRGYGMANPTEFAQNWSIATPLFDVSIDTTNPRRLKIIPNSTMSMKLPGEYRLAPTSNLRCANVVGEPPVEPALYWFWLALDCDNDNDASEDDFLDPIEGCNKAIDCNCNLIADCCDIREDHIPGDPDTCQFDGNVCNNCDCDFNNSGGMNSQDFFDFVNCFFGAGCPPGEDADFNNDNVVNSQDFFDFLTCFFAPCP